MLDRAIRQIDRYVAAILYVSLAVGLVALAVKWLIGC